VFHAHAAATVGNVIKDILDGETKCSNEARDLIVDCCVGAFYHHPYITSHFYDSSSCWHSLRLLFFAEFIQLVSSEANEIAGKANKKVISPEHIIDALKVFPLRKRQLNEAGAWFFFVYERCESCARASAG
jgi:hypothetical protein